MNKILLLFIALISLTNVSYASFPITENNSSDISNTISFQIADEKEKEDEIKWGWVILVLAALGFGAYFLIKAWWRGWRENIRWVKILTYTVLVLLLLLLLLVTLENTVGLVYNMQ